VAILGGKFTAMSAYIKRRGISNNLGMHLKLSETKPQSSRWREIIKIRVKIYETEIKTIQDLE
jgi:hypothetical protein